MHTDSVCTGLPLPPLSFGLKFLIAIKETSSHSLRRTLHDNLLISLPIWDDKAFKGGHDWGPLIAG